VIRRLAVLAAVGIAANAVAGPAGREAFVFTSLAGDARSAALGIPAGALLEGEGALFANPAGAPLALQYSAGITHLAWTDGFFGETLGTMFPVGTEAAVGIAGFLFTHDAVNVTSEVLPDGTGALARPLGVEATILGAAFAFEDLSVGAAVHVVHEQEGDVRREGMALDLGCVWFPDPVIAVGLDMRGFGGPILPSASRDPFPLSFDASVRYEAEEVLPVPFRVYAGASLPLWGPSGGGLAAEFGDYFGASVRGMLELREKGVLGWAFGIGGHRDQWNLDYTFAPAGDLGWAHRIGLTLKFTRKLKPA
jgi:hypothetical protein